MRQSGWLAGSECVLGAAKWGRKVSSTQAGEARVVSPALPWAETVCQPHLRQPLPDLAWPLALAWVALTGPKSLLTGAKASTVVTLPQDSSAPQGRAAPVGAFGTTGRTKKEVLWPGEANRLLATAAEAGSDAKGGNQGQMDLSKRASGRGLWHDRRWQPPSLALSAKSPCHERALWGEEHGQSPGTSSVAQRTTWPVLAGVTLPPVHAASPCSFPCPLSPGGVPLLLGKTFRDLSDHD